MNILRNRLIPVCSMAWLVATSTAWADTGAVPSDVAAQAVAEAAPQVDLAVDRLDDGWRASKRDLAVAYGSLLERRNISLESTIDDDAVGILRERVDEASQASWADLLRWYGAPLLCLVFLAGMLLGLDRRLMRAATRMHERVDYHSIEWINALHRTAIIAMARALPAATLVIASYFPIQALFARAPWTRALTAVLWVFLAWRVVHGFVVPALGFRLVDVSDATARRLWRVVSWALRVVATWVAVHQAAQALGASDAVISWIEVLSLFSVSMVSTSLLGLRDEVVELVTPIRDETHRITRTVRRYFQPTLGATIALLGLGAVGYDAAAFFVISRVYGLLFLFFGTLRLSHWLSNFIAVRVAQSESRDEADLYTSIGRMGRFAAGLALLGVSLKLFLLTDALEALLGAPVLTLGRVEIAPLHIFDGLLVVFVAILMSRVVRAILLGTVYPRIGIDVGVGYAINTLLNYLFIVAGFFVGLTVLGVDLSSLTVVIASLGVGIGLGLQTLTENLVSGFVLLFGRSVKKGDVITVNGLYGRVEDVGARSVVIRTPDNYDMLVPSKSLVNGEVINWSYRDPFIRIHIPVGVSYKSNPREVERVLIRAALAHPRVLRDPAPEVWLKEFADSAINFELLVFYDLREITRDRLKGQLNFIIWDLLAEAGIEIPFPQRDLHLKSAEAFPELAKAVEKLAAKLEGPPTSDS